MDPHRLSASETEPAPRERSAKKSLKVLVWDLDDTLWHGTLLEGDDVRLRPGVREALEVLDGRGILHSIASKNDPEPAWAKLRELGVADYFLYPQIGWFPKSAAVERIAKSINVGLDALALIDDQPFERAEVQETHAEVSTFDAPDVDRLCDLPELMPRFITDESAIRRHMYQADIARDQAQDQYQGPAESFLASLAMRFTLAPVGEDDLKRAEELTLRTNQLNSTGLTYSYEDLDAYRRSPRHLLLVASLEDRFGTYGKIGLALVETGEESWTLKLLLMSCRVISRGVGAMLLTHLMTRARDAGVRFLAEFRDTGRNRMMKVAYRFAGFKEVGRDGDAVLLENDYASLQPLPDYVEVHIL